ncbi:hypothetical protein NQ318_013296 [Aromia moschata]|uniref:Uncharacterized protein n=1 Tax=Aromia moschata TaxID=1265417 RepID=A0AAV8Y0Q8_9CUCU|nr:hypothetical protein NQ318_013296 [Aromia moschata]
MIKCAYCGAESSREEHFTVSIKIRRLKLLEKNNYPAMFRRQRFAAGEELTTASLFRSTSPFSQPAIGQPDPFAAWFHLLGYVNSQNMRLWSADNPHSYIETPLHSQKIGVWAAVSRRTIVGPIFNGTLNAKRYKMELEMELVRILIGETINYIGDFFSKIV